jgi:hypothetical protein
MAAKNSANQRRPTALAKLKAAQKMIASGRAELAAATKKIRDAQRMIDESAQELRETFHRFE